MCIPDIPKSGSPLYINLVVRYKHLRNQEQDLAETINNKTYLQRLCVLGLSENVLKVVCLLCLK